MWQQPTTDSLLGYAFTLKELHDILSQPQSKRPHLPEKQRAYLDKLFEGALNGLEHYRQLGNSEWALVHYPDFAALFIFFQKIWLKDTEQVADPHILEQAFITIRRYINALSEKKSIVPQDHEHFRDFIGVLSQEATQALHRRIKAITT